jgi:protein-disulfide isomerase
MHRNALRAAEAARCAGEQGHFWEMRNLLQSNSDKLELENLTQYARQLKLDGDPFQQCVTNEKYRAAVEADAAQAKGIGAEATPSFLIGTSTPDGVEGQLMMGALPFEAFDQRLQELRSK